MINRHFFRLFPCYIIALILLNSTVPAGAVQPFSFLGPDGARRVLNGPPGSMFFGTQVAALPNGNIVVVDPQYREGTTAGVGAVFLYNGSSLALISKLTGSTDGDMVGAGGITVLSNGNYVVSSPFWTAPGAAGVAGAVTWCSSTTGCSGVVSAANSLVGGSAGDHVGSVVPLSSGDFVVVSQSWDAPGPVADVGAVTWCSGSSGCKGTVSAANSLVGSTEMDSVGGYGITELAKGGYVVNTPYWDAPGVADVGAVTWCSAAGGCKGVVSPANSLVGGNDHDIVGHGMVTPLVDGSYVVVSRVWDNPGLAIDAGAVTWCSGITGCQGQVSSANSLVGEMDNDQVGHWGITALKNGSYVVVSPDWDLWGVYLINDAGAVTWCPGSGAVSGCKGTINATNSLVGSSPNDQVGSGWVIELVDGSYVVVSPTWNAPGAADAGAATWCPGTTACTGEVSTDNSLVGSTASDQVGFIFDIGNGITPLANGGYVVASPSWDAPGAPDAGAATWCPASTPCTGTVAASGPAANSLVGSTAGDSLGYLGVAALKNGGYVVRNPLWDAPGPVVNVGAATWCSGTGGCKGTVSASGAAANSLVGSTAEDHVGNAIALPNGSYVVLSPDWDAPGLVWNAGAVTWCSGSSGCTGLVSAFGSAAGNAAGNGAGNAANSLIGSHPGDRVGAGGVVSLGSGSYVVMSWYWNENRGAATWCPGTGTCTGTVSAAGSLVGNLVGDRVGSGAVIPLKDGKYVVQSPGLSVPGVAYAGALTLGAGTFAFPVGPVNDSNSVIGSVSPARDAARKVDGSPLVWDYDYLNDQLVVGLGLENRVVLLKLMNTIFLPCIRK